MKHPLSRYFLPVNFHSMFPFRQILFLLLLSVLGACHPSSNTVDPNLGDWQQLKSGFPGVARNATVSFQIDADFYVGMGFNSDGERLKDFWKFNADGGFWEQLGRVQSDSAALFPGTGRNGAVAFSLNGKGYVGLGYDNNYKSDFYQYDPSTRTWKKLRDFPGGGRRNAVAFSLNGKAYMGTGYNGNNLQDFWSYDPNTDQWQIIRDFGGVKREGAVAFVLNGKGYVAFGTSNGVDQKNIYEFDPSNNTWTEKTAITSVTDLNARSFASAFVIGDKAYLGLGINAGLYLGDFWEYNPQTDTWIQRTNLSKDCGAGRSYSAGFSWNGTGYITTGINSSGRLDDYWQFYPDNVKTDCK
jgi:N-acetylneuraminic acid mutarotase